MPAPTWAPTLRDRFGRPLNSPEWPDLPPGTPGNQTTTVPVTGPSVPRFPNTPGMPGFGQMPRYASAPGMPGLGQLPPGSSPGLFPGAPGQGQLVLPWQNQRAGGMSPMMRIMMPHPGGSQSGGTFPGGQGNPQWWQMKPQLRWDQDPSFVQQLPSAPASANATATTPAPVDLSFMNPQSDLLDEYKFWGS